MLWLRYHDYVNAALTSATVYISTYIPVPNMYMPLFSAPLLRALAFDIWHARDSMRYVAAWRTRYYPFVGVRACRFAVIFFCALPLPTTTGAGAGAGAATGAADERRQTGRFDSV